MTYSLHYVIAQTPRIKRNAHVSKVLTDNDILDWEDLIRKNIPVKGLWKSEIAVLNDIRNKEIRLRNIRNVADEELLGELRKYGSKHEATRIYNILRRNGVRGIDHVRWKSEEWLSNLPGIGPKSMDILQKIRYKHNNQTGPVSNSGLSYVAQPLFAM